LLFHNISVSVPNAARYQAALRPDILCDIVNFSILTVNDF